MHVARNAVQRMFRLMAARNGIILLDTAISSLTNIATLLLAARLLPPGGLALFSTFQLLIMVGVGVQRAALLHPALAIQRTAGKAHIPLRWLLTGSSPLAVLCGLAAAFFLHAHGAVLGLVLANSLCYFFQDAYRYHLYTTARAGLAALADAVGLVVLVLFVVLASPTLPKVGWSEFALVWLLSGAATMVVDLYSVLRRRRQDSPPASMSHTLRLGVWSGLDSSLAGVATLAPMLVSTFVLSSSAAGTYRVFQSALGPLNVLSTALVTIVGLDAWKLVSSEALLRFRRQVLRLSAALTGGTVVYVFIAILGIVFLTQIKSNDLGRVAVIVALSGALGAFTLPLSAGAAALGRQRVGALLRVLVVGSSFALVSASASGVWVPWSDPIGTLMLASGVVDGVGWAWAFLSAVKREQRLIPQGAAVVEDEHHE